MATERQRVLLVDDDPQILELFEEALSGEGYEITCADTGQRALEEIRRQPFPAAVVDLVLPDIGGLEVVSAIRRADPEAVVVIITGFASLDSAIEAVHRGAYEYLRKPVDVTDLINVLAQGLKHRELSDSEMMEIDRSAMRFGGPSRVKSFSGEEAITSAILYGEK